MDRFIKCLSLFLVLFAGTNSLLSQTKRLDSLWTIYNSKTQADTSRLEAIHDIAVSFNSNKPDTAIILAEQELQLAKQSKQKNYEAGALSIIGIACLFKGSYPKALEYYLKALKVNEEINSKRGIASCYTNIGGLYQKQSNYEKSLEYYLKALKINEEMEVRDLHANWNKQARGDCYNNIGNVYLDLSDYSRALEYYKKDLKICEEMGDKEGIGFCYGNIGGVYNHQLNFQKALEYYLKGLEIAKEVGDKGGIGFCYGSIGEVYISLMDFKRAIQYIGWSLQINKEMGDIDQERYAYQNLAEAFGKIGKYREAYENHIKFKQLTDSIFNVENSKQLGDMKTQFEVEKKEAELKAKAAAQEIISGEEKKKQQIIFYAVAGVLVLVLIFSVFLFKRFRITDKQKKVIEEQKVMVDKAYESLHEKNREVMDSIMYARRIQTALLTSEKYIERNLQRLNS